MTFMKSTAMKVHKGAASIDVLRLDLTGDESYWSDSAKNSGLIFKLTNVLTQIKSNFGHN